MATSKKIKTCEKKICNKCNLNKAMNLFGMDSKAKDGKKGKCKECTSVYIKELRASKGEDEINVNDYGNKGNAEFRRAQKLIAGAKARSKKKKILCTIMPADIVPALIRGFCEATGMPFEFELLQKQNGNNFQHPFAPTIDRIDPDLGYESENVQVVVRGYNSLKGEGTSVQARQIAQALVMVR